MNDEGSLYTDYDYFDACLNSDFVFPIGILLLHRTPGYTGRVTLSHFTSHVSVSFMSIAPSDSSSEDL